MFRFRHSIGSLLLLVLVAGIGFAALKTPNGWWASGVFSTTVAALVLAALAAVHSEGERRAFWLGAALAGGTFLAFGSVESTRDQFVSAPAFAWLEPRMHPKDARSEWSGAMAQWLAFNESGDRLAVTNWSMGGQGSARMGIRAWDTWSGQARDVAAGPFVRIGQVLASWLAALLGGAASRWLFHRAKRPRVREAVPLGAQP